MKGKFFNHKTLLTNVLLTLLFFLLSGIIFASMMSVQKVNPDLYYFPDGPVIYCIHLKSDKIVWRRELPVDSIYKPVWDESRVYCIDEKGTVFALDRTSGEIIWQKTYDKLKEQKPELFIIDNALLIAPYFVLDKQDGKFMLDLPGSKTDVRYKADVHYFVRKPFLYIEKNREFVIVKIDVRSGNETVIIRDKDFSKYHEVCKIIPTRDKIFILENREHDALPKTLICIDYNGNLIWKKEYHIENIIDFLEAPSGKEVFVVGEVDSKKKNPVSDYNPAYIPVVMAYNSSTGINIWKKFIYSIDIFFYTMTTPTYYDGKIWVASPDKYYGVSIHSASEDVSGTMPEFKPPLFNEELGYTPRPFLNSLIKDGKLIRIYTIEHIYSGASAINILDLKSGKSLPPITGNVINFIDEEKYPGYLLVKKSPEKIVIVNIQTGKTVRSYNLEPVTGLTPVPIKVEKRFAIPMVRLLPDGERIYCVIVGRDRGWPTYTGRIYNFSGDVLYELFSRFQQHLISPDMSKIVDPDFLSKIKIKDIHKGTEEIIELGDYSLDGSNPGWKPDLMAWSPDGSKLAFIAGYSGKGNRMFAQRKLIIHDVNTGNRVSQIINPGYSAYQIMYSPDGKKIALYLGEYNKDNFIETIEIKKEYLQLWDVEGDEKKSLAEFDFQNVYNGLSLISFSPDGNKIYYEDPEVKGLVEIDIDGKNKRLLLEGFDFVISPSGKKIIFRNGNGLYLFNRETKQVQRLIFDNHSIIHGYNFMPSEDKIILSMTTPEPSRVYILDLKTISSLPGQFDNNDLIKMKLLK